MTTQTVLIVDDDPGITAFVGMALEDEGYRVVTSVNGESLQVARDLHPAVILLDIMMPGMDGVEVSRRLRADPRTADIPIIVMSAKYRLDCKYGEMPAEACLPKPFELDDLYSAVEHCALAS